MTSAHHHAEPAPRDTVAKHLAKHRSRYLTFVRSRLANAEAAEDLLHEAMSRALAQAAALRGPVEPWFFRMLRNAIVDHMRRRAASARALAALEVDLRHSSPAKDQVEAPCPCVVRVQRTLKPEYAEALEQVTIAELPVKEFASRNGLSLSNAGVRLFRAREALHRRILQTCGACAANGCRGCTCAAV